MFLLCSIPAAAPGDGTMVKTLIYQSTMDKRDECAGKGDKGRSHQQVPPAGGKYNGSDVTCCTKRFDCDPPQEIICRWKSAVVRVTGQFILASKRNVELIIPVTGSTPLGADSRADVFIGANGFFVKGHHIVCPASAVLLPPSLTSTVLRWPLTKNPPNTALRIQSEFTRASRVIVTVYGIPGKGCDKKKVKVAYSYEADIIGIDGAGDIAVLWIDVNRPYNKSFPCIPEDHPYFVWGDSRRSLDGDRIYLIGNNITSFYAENTDNSANALIRGILSKHRHVDYQGWVLPELLLLDAVVIGESTGSPVIDCEGRVIGMQTTSLDDVNNVPTGINNFPTTSRGNGSVCAISQKFMEDVVRKLGASFCTRKHDCKVLLIDDPAGSYLRYMKGYLGIAYNVVTGPDFTSTTDYTSTATVSSGTGDGFPRIRLDDAGEFVPEPECKKVEGIKVIGIAGLNPTQAAGVVGGLWYVPGGDAFSAPLLVAEAPISNFITRIQPGDIILEINAIPVGDLHHQVAPSLVSWRTCPGDLVEICYRRGGQVLNTLPNGCNDQYGETFKFSGKATAYSPVNDYPWYNIQKFTNILTPSPSGYPFFTASSAAQDTANMYPAITTGSFFHPSL